MQRHAAEFELRPPARREVADQIIEAGEQGIEPRQFAGVSDHGGNQIVHHRVRDRACVASTLTTAGWATSASSPRKAPARMIVRR